MIRLSTTSKLDGIKSWSLQAIETCPGSADGFGGLVDACKGCYATTGNYRFPNVKAPRIFNREDWQRIEWADDMVSVLENERFFRWFDSGDMYHVALAEKILEVMIRTPWVKHWLPTRMHKFPKFRTVLESMKRLDNVSVRFSSDSVRGEFTEGLHGSVIIPKIGFETEASICEAYRHGGKCNGCRKCWNKEISTIAYVAHGAKMAKVVKISKGV